MVNRANAPGTAVTLYSGAKTITCDSHTGGYWLNEYSRGGTTTQIHTLNFKKAPATTIQEVDNGIDNVSEFSDNDNNWTASEYNNSNQDIAALDAHWAAEKTFDYFKAVHSRDSYDGNNGVIKCYVHLNTRDNNNNIVPMDNSFWLDSKKALFLGDGHYLSPLVSLDIAHEVGHGVSHSAVANGTGLISNGESGALDESLSDIWGACVEQWSVAGKQT